MFSWGQGIIKFWTPLDALATLLLETYVIEVVFVGKCSRLKFPSVNKIQLHFDPPLDVLSILLLYTEQKRDQ